MSETEATSTSGKEIISPTRSIARTRTQLLAHCVRQATPDLFALSAPTLKASVVRVEFGYFQQIDYAILWGIFFICQSPMAIYSYQHVDLTDLGVGYG